MYFSSTSFLSLLVTVGAVAASVRGGSTTGARSLSQVTLANSNGSNEEVCFQGFVNTAEEQLTELLINQLLGKSTSDHASKFSSFPKVTQTVSGVPDYLVGCSIFDFKCMECSLCKDVYETLVETGSEAACDAACIVVVEAAGGGPEDPIADVVAAACIPLCAAIFESSLPSAQSACAQAHLCSSN